MTLENQSLVLDLLEWVARTPRRYCDVMDAWRTSCPRLTIWEDAVDHGLVMRNHDNSGEPVVEITEAGLSMLKREGRLSQSTCL
jgi:hypothetical protein